MSKRSRKGSKGKSEEERLLEEIVFGSSSPFEYEPSLDEGSNESVGNSHHNFVSEAHNENTNTEQSASTAQSKQPQAVWKDDEDDDIIVDLNATARLKKLKKSIGGNNLVSGNQLTKLLRDRFELQSPEGGAVDWDAVAEAQLKQSSESRLLSDSTPFVDDSAKAFDGSVAPLPAVKLDIKRLMDANFQEPSRDKITAVDFHSNGNLMLASGVDKFLRIFRIDGEANEKQLSVRFPDMSILCAQFVPYSDEVILGGRTPFFYSYDCESGTAIKIPGLLGKNIKSHEKLTCSPDGTKIALQGTSGYAYILDSKRKTRIMELKMNSSIRSQCFLSDTLFATSGLDAEVYLWDLRKTGRCVTRFKHDDGMCSSALDGISTTSLMGQSNIAVGSESGVVSIYQCGDQTFTSHTSSGSSATSNSFRRPSLQYSIMNLTTRINCVKFHPSGQLLAIASKEKKDQLRLVHVPSGRVYSNWPTENTPLKKIECLAFSSGGAFFAVGNNKGRVLLYRLNHFNTA